MRIITVESRNKERGIGNVNARALEINCKEVDLHRDSGDVKEVLVKKDFFDDDITEALTEPTLSYSESSEMSEFTAPPLMKSRVFSFSVSPSRQSVHSEMLFEMCRDPSTPESCHVKDVATPKRTNKTESQSATRDLSASQNPFRILEEWNEWFTSCFACSQSDALTTSQSSRYNTQGLPGSGLREDDYCDCPAKVAFPYGGRLG